MSENPFVSIVVPTYNRRESLKECLDRIFNQTYPTDRFEVLVVDDGSGDGTKEFLAGYKAAHQNLRYFSQSNRGPSGARNLGIENSMGEIVCFTDDDCLVEGDWLSRLVCGFVDEKVGGVGGKILTYKPTTLLQKYVEDSRLLDQENFRSTNFLITGNVAYRKKALIEAGGFDLSLNACEDLDLSIRIQMLGYTLSYSGDAVVYHRFNPNLWGLFRQQYRNALGYARLHKKYAKHFNVVYNLLIYSYRIAAKIITYPFVAIKVILGTGGEKGYALMKPLLDILILAAFIFGLTSESLFGGGYNGIKVKEKVSFLEEQSEKTLIKKLFSKIF